MINSLSFSRFSFLRRFLIKARREEAEEKLILAAFVGWQMGAGGKMTYGEYLYSLGLSDEPPQQPDTQASKEKGDNTEVLKRMGIEVKKVKAKQE